MLQQLTQWDLRAVTKPLADEGVVPRIELLKLQRQVNDTRREMTSSELKIPVLQKAFALCSIVFFGVLRMSVCVFVPVKPWLKTLIIIGEPSTNLCLCEWVLRP